MKFASDSPNFLTSSSPKNLSQNLKKNISKRSGKFLKNARVPTETVVLTALIWRPKAVFCGSGIAVVKSSDPIDW
ncbi:hypothetical protein MKT69_14395 [Leptospira borgpetersenii]|uniref:hypothetical protein n=1 Tax=Leptospira borgpetersenii TaxID=174 RepID=UPI0027DD787F|nr:hypothetical protein [Leptospira borgpetersenii]MCH1890670.1 hypothetical protein [Leptospira borgpetersenii]